jgi:hypothetical protein
MQMHEETKKCKTCQVNKLLTEFYIRKGTNDTIKYSGECKECTRKRSKQNHEKIKKLDDFISKKKAYAKQYRQDNKRTVNGWYTKTYSRMTRDNKRKFNLSLPFSKDEFIKWIQENYKDKFKKLFQDYVDSECNKYLNPSIDRIDDYKSYTFDNMQLITWKENDVKGTNGVKNKVSCAEVGKKYCSKTVMQYDTENNLLMLFSSTHEAERVTGIDSSLIAKACRKYIEGGTGYAKGYIWHYKEDETNQNNIMEANINE